MVEPRKKNGLIKNSKKNGNDVAVDGQEDQEKDAGLMSVTT